MKAGLVIEIGTESNGVLALSLKKNTIHNLNVNIKYSIQT